MESSIQKISSTIRPPKARGRSLALITKKLTAVIDNQNRMKSSFEGWYYKHQANGRTLAHSMLIAIFFVLSGHQFKDLGADYYNQFNKEKKINSHVRQLSKLGVTVPDDVLKAAFEPPPD